MKYILTPVFGIVAPLIVCGSASAFAGLFDDFSDLNDTANPPWNHLDGLIQSSGQTWDASTGQYRLTAPNNGTHPLLPDYGFVGSYTGSLMSDVVASADFVAFNGSPAGGVFGIGVRLNGNGGVANINNLNALTGYGYAWEPFAAGGLGEMVLYRITGASLQDIGSQQVTLDPNKDYRFKLSAIGNQIHGQVFEIGSGMQVAEEITTDGAWTTGFSGVFGYSAPPAMPVDFTIDSFGIVPEPSTMLLGLFTAAMLMASRRDRMG
jgi:hypothetical protein